MENIEILIIMSGITFLYYMKKEHDNRYKETSKDKSSKNNSKQKLSSKNNSKQKLSSKNNSKEKLSSKNKSKKSDESTEVLNKKIKDYNNMKYIINSIQRLNK